MIAPYPLATEPILKEKVWGGRRLTRFGKALPAGALVGESWELADLAATSPSGGGGNEARSRIRRGPLAGSTVHDALEAWGSDLVGEAGATPAEGFPLLVKFLDARQHLSVQVHPTAEYVAGHPDAHLKAESWYVLAAEPGAVIYKGLAPGVTRHDLARAVASGEVAGVLAEVPVQRGECHHLPSGTVHALGAGVVVAEVQTPSDTTFRLYDWQREYGRPQRPLHVTEALECADVGPAPAPARVPSGTSAGPLVATEHFWVWQLRGGAPFAEPAAAGWRVVMVTAGSGRLLGGPQPPLDVAIGDTVLVPAAVAPAIEVELAEGAEALYVGPGSSAQPAFGG